MALNSKWLGYKLQSPLIISSGQNTTTGSNLGKWAETIAENKWGGVVTKTYFPGSDVYSIPYLWTTQQYRNVAMQNCGPNLQQFSRGEDKRLQESIRISHSYGLVVAVSIMASSVDEWVALAKRAEADGADIIELNYSCPAAINSIENNKLGGYQLSKTPDIVTEVTSKIVEAVSIPVAAKLTPNTSDITILAKASLDGGAKGITAINTVQGIIGVDVETAQPACSDVLGNSFKTGISGPAIKPVGLRLVADIAQAFPKVPITGVGGINTWSDAVEYILLRAENVGICTAVMQKGFGIGKAIYDGIEDYSKRHKYRSISSFKGRALEHVTSVSVECPKSAAFIDLSKCVNCGKCYTACHEGAYDAIKKLKSGLKVDQKKCASCGLCKVVCPNRAISINIL